MVLDMAGEGLALIASIAALVAAITREDAKDVVPLFADLSVANSATVHAVEVQMTILAWPAIDLAWGNVARCGSGASVSQLQRSTIAIESHMSWMLRDNTGSRANAHATKAK